MNVICFVNFSKVKKHLQTMLILHFLVSLSFSYQCRHSIFAQKEIPIRETFQVDEGEHICINSSKQYLSVVFHDSFASVRYFSSKTPATLYSADETRSLTEVGKFLFPAEKGGVSFPTNNYGSVDVLALMPGNITISYFNFPTECSAGRYVTTKASDDIDVDEVFGQYPGPANPQVCVWYPNEDYTFQTATVPSDDDKIMICKSNSDCIEPITRTKQFVEVTSSPLIKVQLSKKEFWEGITFQITQPNPTNLFQISGAIDNENPSALSISVENIQKVIRGQLDNPNQDDDDKRVGPKDADDDHNDDNGPNNDLRRHFDNDVTEENQHNSHKDNRRSHSHKAKKSNFFAFFFQLLIFMILIALILFAVLQYTGKINYNKLFKPRVNDHSSDRLLPNGRIDNAPNVMGVGTPNGGYGGFLPWIQHQGQAIFPQFISGQPVGQPQYFASSSSTAQSYPQLHGGYFAPVQATPAATTNNDDASKSEQPQPQLFQQPVVYVVPPQFQQQWVPQPQYPQQQPQQPNSEQEKPSGQ